jgi:hypothetical protein
MIKLRYETVSYNHRHGAWSSANIHRDIDEAFADKPVEKLMWLTHKIDELEAQIRVERMAQERKS